MDSELIHQHLEWVKSIEENYKYLLRLYEFHTFEEDTQDCGDGRISQERFERRGCASCNNGTIGSAKD